MPNTLYLPELREMLAENNVAEIHEFCQALHPARTAEFMEGLDAQETWGVLRHADPGTRVEIFSYIEHPKQVEVIASQPREEIAALLAEMAADDRVDLLSEVDSATVQELIPLLPPLERRDTLRLQAYPEGTAGALMTTEMARLTEDLTVRQALAELTPQAEHLETIYYIYVVDANGHLRGVVSTRELVSKMGKPDVKLGDIMESKLVSVNVQDDQEEVARRVARYDLLAIPVVDNEQRLVGIITHDDIVDVLREEATEDLHRIAAVAPLDTGYLKTHLLTMSWKRGIWLTILFFASTTTAITLGSFEEKISEFHWLVAFLPLVISCGGNSGNQSATLVIAGLAGGDLTMDDWRRIVLREIAMGLILGSFLGLCGMVMSVVLLAQVNTLQTALIVPLTLLAVVTCGALSGATLVLVFKRLGLDPALMSSPFVAGLMDIMGIIIYMNVALTILT